MKKILIITLTICLVFSGQLFAYWVCQTHDVKIANAIFSVGVFEWNECQADLIIDEQFYNDYMILIDDNYEWKIDENGNVESREIIAFLTPFGTIIKADICYLVIATSYNLIYHGLPNQNTTLDWALTPTTINYVQGWSYRKNRVVKATDDCYYMARYYLSTNPMENREGWDKIEPVSKQDFCVICGKTMPNYACPILSNIHRSYVWDGYTLYKTDDVVICDNVIFKAKRNSCGVPPISSPWAWEII